MSSARTHGSEPLAHRATGASTEALEERLQYIDDLLQLREELREAERVSLEGQACPYCGEHVVKRYPRELGQRVGALWCDVCGVLPACDQDAPEFPDDKGQCPECGKVAKRQVVSGFPYEVLARHKHRFLANTWCIGREPATEDERRMIEWGDV